MARNRSLGLSRLKMGESIMLEPDDLPLFPRQALTAQRAFAFEYMGPERYKATVVSKENGETPPWRSGRRREWPFKEMDVGQSTTFDPADRIAARAAAHALANASYGRRQFEFTVLPSNALKVTCVKNDAVGGDKTRETQYASGKLMTHHGAVATTRSAQEVKAARTRASRNGYKVRSYHQDRIMVRFDEEDPALDRWAKSYPHKHKCDEHEHEQEDPLA